MLGVSTNTAHLSSFTKQNFSLQMAHKSTLLSLTFLGPLSPSAIFSLTALLSSQRESTNPLTSSEVLLSWQSLALDDLSPRKYSLCLPFFAYDCRSPGGTVYSFRYHQPLLKRKKNKTLSFELLGDTDILNSGRQERRASLKPFTFIVTVVSTFHSYFRAASELISIVSNWSMILW